MTAHRFPRRAFVIRATQLLCVVPVSGALGCTSTNGGAEATTAPGTGTGGEEGSSGGCCAPSSSTSMGSGSESTTAAESATGTETATSGTGAATTSDSSTDSGASTSGVESGSTSSESSSTGQPPDECEPSPSDIEGPFYRPGIPVGGNLDVHGDAGIPLTLRGNVVSTDCAPLAGAIVEVWHASPVAPGGAPGDDDATYDNTNQYRYYGQVATLADGSFEFITKKPGWYLNGAQHRPAHLHLKVWVRGVERLTTQLYFVGDPFNAMDQWFNPVMALTPDGAGVAELEVVV